jgi:hypothetical protein
MSAPPRAIAPNPHTNLLNVYIQLANKMGFQQKKLCRGQEQTLDDSYVMVHKVVSHVTLLRMRDVRPM